MTDLSRLNVSLTKHNAHKIARLLKRYPADQILQRLREVQAEEAQARKNLSILPGNEVPQVWEKVKKLGDNAIDALVLVAIIFSHHELIDAMTNASARLRFSGRIDRGAQLDGKAYTNFARVIDQLGFATKLEYSGISFDLTAIFETPGLSPLVSQLLTYKLYAASWDGSGEIAGEAVAQGFHRVFGIEAKEFANWLSANSQPRIVGTSLLPKDKEFFQKEDEGSESKPFAFRPGHAERAVEPILKSASAKTKVTQLHNDIQNRLYKYLCTKCGTANVGTEIDSGSGTTIDIATVQPGRVIFYEIKTSSSVRASIRQAIPQLLEYAYWSDEKKADELVIVSHLPITKAAGQYLSRLQKLFKLPISYRQFDLKTNQLR